MELAWWLAVGLLFATYFALGGLDYGVGLLLPAMGGDAGRRAALNAIGPRFLGNEVWVVAAIGVLIGAFPILDGELLTGAQPVVLVLLLALMAVNAGVQLRSRADDRGRRRFDVLIVGSSGVLAVGWGYLVGTLLTGYSGGFGHLWSLPALLCGLSTAALFVRHGATYLNRMLPAGPARDRAGRSADRAMPVALTAVVLTIAATAVAGDVDQPVPAAVGAALLLAAIALGRRGLAWTALAAALPVVVVGLARYPYALPALDGGGLTVAEAAARPESLRLLGWVLLPALPVLVGFQVWCWRAFRVRPDEPVPVYW